MPERRRLAWFTPIVGGALSGALLYLAFWPLQGGSPLAIVQALSSLASVAVLAWIGARTDRPLISGVLTSVGQSWVWAVWHLWVIDVSAPGYFGMIPILAVYAGVFVAGMAWLNRVRSVWSAVGAAALWGGLEWLRADVLFGGYAFYLVGHPLIDVPGAWGVARVIGAGGTSALVGGVGACLGLVIGLRELRKRASIALAGLTTGLIAIGVIGIASEPERDPSNERAISVGIVQTNVPQSVRGGWDGRARAEALLILGELTLRAAEDGAEVIVWPETMFPGQEFDDESAAVWERSGLGIEVEGGGFFGFAQVRDEVLGFQRELGVPIVIGARAASGLRLEELPSGGLRPITDASYNSAFVVENGAVRARYDKQRLTPFGEVIPYVHQWDWLESLVLRVGLGASGMTFDLESGSTPGVMDAAKLGKISTPICFEATMAGQCRRLVGGGAGVLVNLTNDGWFGGSDAGRATHLLAARWRCAELARPMVRAANTGISASISARGRVDRASEPRSASVLVIPVTPADPELRTPWSRFGHGWPIIAWGCVLVGGIARWRSGRVRAEETEQEADDGATEADKD